MRLYKVSHLYSVLKNSPIQKLKSEHYSARNLEIHVKRDDLIHPVISGNKWRKLKYLLLEIEKSGKRRLAAMGGRYSNLLHSLGYICKLLDWELELYVLGYPEQKDTPTLADLRRWGGRINLVNRQTFQSIRNIPPELDSDVFWIAEGGYHSLALKGVKETFYELPERYDYIITASATGTTLAGYVQQGNALNTKVMGVAVLRNDDEIAEHLFELTGERNSAELIKGYDAGGFGKSCSEVERWIKKAKEEFNIPLEPVYSGKSFWALNDLIEKNYFPEGSKILFVHCGGLQGRR